MTAVWFPSLKEVAAKFGSMMCVSWITFLEEESKQERGWIASLESGCCAELGKMGRAFDLYIRLCGFGRSRDTESSAQYGRCRYVPLGLTEE